MGEKSSAGMQPLWRACKKDNDKPNDAAGLPRIIIIMDQAALGMVQHNAPVIAKATLTIDNWWKVLQLY